MKAIVHACAGSLAIALVVSFLSATIISEVLLDVHAITWVKGMILWGIGLLISSMAVTGASGFLLGKNRAGPIIQRKQKRMKLIAANGLLVLLPAAIFLYLRATAGLFDSLFYGVQIVEIAAGFLQLYLLVMNFREGWHLGKAKRHLKSVKNARQEELAS